MTWSTVSASALRHRLGVDRTVFAKIVGTSERTVARWESGKVEPVGASACIMMALEKKLDEDPEHASGVVAFVVDAAAFGGLPYLFLKLLNNVPLHEGQTTPPLPAPEDRCASDVSPWRCPCENCCKFRNYMNSLL